MRSLENCSVIKGYTFLKQRKPKQENGKCEGYGFLYPDGKNSACEKCKLHKK